MAADPVVSFHANRLLVAIDAATRMGQAMMVHTLQGVPLYQLATMDRGSRWNPEKRATVFNASLGDELIAAGICVREVYDSATLIRRKPVNG
jgi:hypothetical protein